MSAPTNVNIVMHPGKEAEGQTLSVCLSGCVYGKLRKAATRLPLHAVRVRRVPRAGIQEVRGGVVLAVMTRAALLHCECLRYQDFGPNHPEIPPSEKFIHVYEMKKHIEQASHVLVSGFVFSL